MNPIWTGRVTFPVSRLTIRLLHGMGNYFRVGNHPGVDKQDKKTWVASQVPSSLREHHDDSMRVAGHGSVLQIHLPQQGLVARMPVQGAVHLLVFEGADYHQVTLFDALLQPFEDLIHLS